MQGKLDKNELGRWEIVDDLGTVLFEVTSGDVIEVYSFHRQDWIKTRIEHNGRDYVAMVGVGLYIGQLARTVGR